MIKHLLSFITTTALFLLPTIAQAQTYTPSNRPPVADSTLIGTQVSVRGNNFDITGGLQRGQTLFHSFTDFSIPTDRAANFLNPVGNRDIITRVTGGLFSDINGVLNSNGANFFLINPNGVVFGTNAQLNVGRAFMASTANGIDLVGGGGAIAFGTNPNGDAPLLSVAPNVLFDVSRLNLGGGNGGISNFGTLQTTNPSQYIGLIGENVTLNGGKVIAPGGRVDLGGLATPGSITWSGNNLIFPTSLTRSNVTLTDGASVSVAGSGGGSVAVNAQNLNVLNGSEIAAGISENAPNSQAGNIDIDVVENIDVGGNSPSFIRNEVFKNAVGNSGKVTIKTDGLRVTGGSQISSSTNGTGNAGDLTVNANKVSVSGEALDKNGVPFSGGLLAKVNPGATGNAGNLNLTTQTLNISNGSVVQASTFGNGNGGNLFVKADEINIFNDSGFSPQFYTMVDAGIGYDQYRNVDSAGNRVLATGNGGKLTIKTNRLSIRNGAYVSVDNEGIGKGADIIINASSLEVIGRLSGIVANTYEGGGNAGDITITTNLLRSLDGASISSSTYGKGNAGNLTINAQNVQIDQESPRTPNSAPIPTGLFTQVEPNATGKAGNITLTTKTLSVSNGGKVQAATFAKGNGGNIVIKADEIDVFESPDVNPEQRSNINVGIGFDIDRNRDAAGNEVLATGKGGNLTIETRRLSIRNGAFISSDSRGIGSAGTLKINAKVIELQNRGRIDAETRSGQGGNIDLTVSDYLLMRQNSQISATAGTAQQGGDGGNITINSPLIVALPGNSDITANAYTGKGGTLTIKSDGLFGIQYRPKGQDSLFTNDITASSDFNQQGTVDIDTPGTDPGRDTTELPNTAIDASNQISQICSAENRRNKLTVTGRGGLPENAYEPLNSPVVWQDARAVSSQPAVNPTTNNPAQLPPPAVGWVFDGKGKVTLIAAGGTGQPTRMQVVCPNQ